jgi:hypothetical protein
MVASSWRIAGKSALVALVALVDRDESFSLREGEWSEHRFGERHDRGCAPESEPESHDRRE